MPKGLSLHLGLNSVDPRHYAGWSGPLQACEADAHDMQAIAKARGFTPASLLTRQATRAKVVAGITAAAKKLKAGDLFFLTYSGHGGQIPDQDGDEVDGFDETWCLFDGELIDDELRALYAKFAKGVRILVLSDSCHSGSVIAGAFAAPAFGANTSEPPASVRALPRALVQRVYQANKGFYDGIAAGLKKTPPAAAQASRLLISGCQDNQTSSDGLHNGLFTGTLLRVWNGGNFQGSYRDLHRQILRRMPAGQSPNLMMDGAADPAFLAQSPFTL